MQLSSRVSRLAAAPPAVMVPVLAVVALVVATITYLIGWRHPVDINIYRLGALAALHGDPLYDSRFGDLGLPFTYPPFAAAVLIPLAVLPAALANILWLAFSLLLVVDIAVTLQRWAAEQGWRRVPVPALALGLLVMQPTTSTLGFGQVNLLLFALLLRDASGRTPLPQGVLTGLCAGFKLTPAAFGLFYLCTRRWAALRNSALAGLGTVVVTWAVLPAASHQFWIDAVFADPARPGPLWFLSNQSLTGALTRGLSPDTGKSLALLLAMPVVLAAAWIAHRAHREGRDLLAFAVVVTVPLLISPISWMHHWVTMAVPILAVAIAPWRVSEAARRLVLGLLVVVFFSRIMTMVLPEGKDQELAFGVGGDLLSTSYTVAALMFLALAGWEVTRRRVPVAVPEADLRREPVRLAAESNHSVA